MFACAEFQRIFLGLSINSTVYLRSARLWIEPFDPATDKFAMIGNDYAKGLSGRADDSAGVLEITQTGGPTLTKRDWDDVINMPAYKLDIPVSTLLGIADVIYTYSLFFPLCQHYGVGQCKKYVKGQYERTFYLQVTDRFGRMSNVLTKTLDIQTGELCTLISLSFSPLAYLTVFVL